MKKYLFFVCALALTFPLFGMTELGTSSNRHDEIEELIQHSLSGYGLSSNDFEIIRMVLPNLSEDAYLKILGGMAQRGRSAKEEEQNAAAVIQALAKIAEHLDTQTKLMEARLAESERAHGKQEEQDDRELDLQIEESRDNRAWKKYKWKVTTVLGALGSLIGTTMAVWQGEIATQCMQNTTAQQ